MMNLNRNANLKRLFASAWMAAVILGAVALNFHSPLISRGLSSVEVTDDTALYQNLSEIRVQKQGPMNFDRDIQELAAMAPRYKEKLPSADLRVSGAIKRTAAQKYAPASARR
jgi:hypothetical protein